MGLATGTRAVARARVDRWGAHSCSSGFGRW